MKNAQADPILDSDIESVKGILSKLEGICTGEDAANVYTALTYALGTVIGMSKVPAEVLCHAIPRLAKAAKVDCVRLDPDEELDEEEAEQHVSQPQSIN